MLIDSIVNAVSSDKNEILISPFEFSTSKENEFLIFFKPETFFSANEDLIKESVKMTLEKLEENGVTVSGAILFSGSRLEELGIMDRHYGFINKVSKNISKIATSEEIAKICEVLEIDNIEEYSIYGGHEFMASHTDYTEESLDDLWLSKKSAKVRSGFYVQKYEVNGEKFILADAFHPVQLKHYTDPAHKTVVLLCNSDKDWSDLRDRVIGDTFPEKAQPESVRGEFYANKDKYGLKEVSISYNCIHMSAGAYEAAFEINNFLKDCALVEYNPSMTNIHNKMLTAGITSDKALDSLNNPKANIDGKEVGLFDITENINTSEAINIFKNY